VATKKADRPEGADSDGTGLFGMDDLRARLDAPLFHRDPGLAVPAQLPRLEELSLDHAVEAPTHLVPSTPPTPLPPPVVEDVAAPPARQALVSFSDMLSLARRKASEPLAAPEPMAAAPEPMIAAPEPMAAPKAVAAPRRVEAPVAGVAETEALLAVLADFKATAKASPVLAEPPRAVAVVPAVVVPAAVVPAAIAKAEPIPEAVVDLTTVLPTTGPRSSVEEELNRLAFLPDQEEPIGRVVVPPIAHTDQNVDIGVPVLSQHEMYSPRVAAIAAPKHHVFEPTVDVSKGQKRRKKGRAKRLFSLIVILAILGGGLYAAKYYLLDPKWDSEVEVIAKEVEAARQLEFGHAVKVTTLTGDEYALRIARYALGVDEANEDAVAGELRALGLLTGGFDLRVIGLVALPEAPAFYDASDERIYVVDGLPLELYRFAMHRALATALLDQEYGWGGRTSGATPAVIRGTRALYEADGLATALSMLSATDRALVLEQRAGLFTTFSAPPTPSQFGTAVASRLGVSLRAFVESVPLTERPSLLSNAAISDAQALDVRRLVSGVAEAPAAGRSQGALFWYHVLATRLDPAPAWNNALALQRDAVVVEQSTGRYCVSAVLTVSADALPGVAAAFAAWAAAAPAESTTTVASSAVEGGGQVLLSACDPGIAVATSSGAPTLTMGGAPLRSEQYRLLLVARPDLARTQAACAVYGGDNVSLADERWVVDGVEGWTAPAAHPTPDPNRAGCA